ncbi:hypothetical protein [Sutterella wadsworthensis]|uniref:hypothetical protein n=1 Tax=Sutterella wadsworthensis TaxID=40545 RepID=UPI0013F60E8B|nr:hypothetical protein [Sutterella wadsworthensis]
MSECLKCKHCGRLEPLPRGDPSRLQSGQWGMLARGLVYCRLLGPSGYQRFRSVESKDECKYFEPEPDADRIARRFETVRILRAAFDQWRIDQQLKAKQAKDKK